MTSASYHIRVRSLRKGKKGRRTNGVVGAFALWPHPWPRPLQEVTMPAAKRPSNWPLWACLVLLLLFAGLAAHQITSRKVRLATDPELLARLAEAEFLEDEPLPARQAAEWPQWRGP